MTQTVVRSVRALDAMIAAVCLAVDLAVHTCDPADLTEIDGLTVMAVPHPHH